MLESLLTFFYQLPLGILFAAGLLECFVIFKDRRDAEPAVLWLLCCAAVTALLCAGVHYMISATTNYAVFVGLAAATAAVGFWFKRQARNLGVSRLKDRFYPPGSYAPVQMPNQTTFIMGYRASLVGAAGLAFAALIIGKVLVPGTGSGTGSADGGGGALAVNAPPAVAPATPPAPATGDPAAPPATPAPGDPAAPAVASTTPPTAPDPTAPDPATPADPAAPPTTPATPADPTMASTAPTTPPPAGTPAPPAGTPAPAPGTPAPAPGTPPVAPATPGPSQAAVFADMRPISKNSLFGSKVRPLIQRHCITCHGADKQKGDLRLDTPDFIRAGVRGKPVIVAGKPDASGLLASISKPLGDEDRMPPKGDGIGAGDVAMIKKWIADGADFGDGVSAGSGGAVVFAEDKLAATLQAPPAALLEELKKEGVLVRPISKDGKVLDLDFSHTDYRAGEMKLDRLKPISLNVNVLDFSRTRISDGDLANLSGMTHLSKLVLARTEITDAGITHLKGLGELSYLNIYQTKVTDGGLRNLEGMSKLQKLYVWQSMVTPAGASSLQNKIAGLVINNGGTAPAETPK